MGGDSVRVFWQVAEDEAMTKVVAKGQTVAAAGLGHSVHAEVRGLKPDRWYWYQFKAGGEVSPKGRTRTLERPDRPANETSPLKMAFASCQHYEGGYYTAFEHMAADVPEEKSPADRKEFLKRRAAAYQAYYEHMPLRTTSSIIITTTAATSAAASMRIPGARISGRWNTSAARVLRS